MNSVANEVMMPLASSATRKRVSGSGSIVDIGLNAAAAGHHPAGIGLKLFLLLLDSSCPLGSGF